VTRARCLGRVQSHPDTRTLKFATYFGRSVLAATGRNAPPARDWTHPTHAPAWRSWRNDVIGDCTCAAIAHLFQAQSANTGRLLDLDDADVVGLYERVGHYNPARPETDQGAQMIDVLRAMREVGMGGQRISAFAALDPMNRWHIDAALNLFGGIYVGVDLPIAAQTQTVWDVAPVGRHDRGYDPGSWGPHAMAMLAYDRSSVAFITWGQVKIATHEWFKTYCSEAWALIDPLWVDDGLTPSGFDLARLRSDLVDIHRGAKGAA